MDPNDEESINKLRPEDPLSKLPVPVEIQKTLQAQQIFTIRHFALCNLTEILSWATKYGQLLSISYHIANLVVSKYSYTKPQENTAEVWGYIYVSEDFYEYTKREKALKSAYVLFQEYVNTPPEKRELHPWVRVYHTYAKEAANWCGTEIPNDLDVYSYMVWRASGSFANLDYTAGPRAIYFNWWCLKVDGHKYCVAVDKMLSKQLNDPLLEHRNDRVLQVNLTAVVQHCQGKIFRLEPSESQNWIPTNLEEAKDRSSDGYRYKCTINPGDNFYASNYPHGCIVTPTGTIPGDYIAVSDKLEEELEGEDTLYGNTIQL